MPLKDSRTMRTVTEVGQGDYVKVRGSWKRISTNTATGASRIPRGWSIHTEDGGTYGMWDIDRYAKASDME